MSQAIGIQLSAVPRMSIRRVYTLAGRQCVAPSGAVGKRRFAVGTDFAPDGRRTPSEPSRMPSPPARFKQSIGSVASRAALEHEISEGGIDSKLWADICSELYHHLKHQSPRNISLVLSSLARIRLHDAALLDYVADRLNGPWLCSFNVQDLALLVNSYAQLAHPAPGLFRLCAEELLWKLPEAGPQELALVASSHAKLRAYDAALFRHVAAISLRNLEETGPRHSANLLHAFARVSAPAPTKFFSELATKLCEPGAAGDLTAVGVAHAAFAAGRAASAKAPQEAARPLLEVLARRLVIILRQQQKDRPGDAANPHHVAILSRACLQAGLHSHRLNSFLAFALAPVSPEGDGELKSRANAAAASASTSGRSNLLELVDAASSILVSLHKLDVKEDEASLLLKEVLRESLSLLHRSSQAKFGKTSDKKSLGGKTKEEIALLSTRQSSSARESEMRRLALWDAHFSSWLSQEWSEELRAGLLGSSVPRSEKNWETETEKLRPDLVTKTSHRRVGRRSRHSEVSSPAE
eukprot:TRINITY_DN18633_c0_g1_i1.p1 TRINITY_DN18633_c0_g1~~TRINITY_DN18633_c0_g1_i1.p1  ORF type:complete len:532 (-),score=80.09 TRINITY_DN18633_c0_g1_i1:74-1648(-)